MGRLEVDGTTPWAVCIACHERRPAVAKISRGLVCAECADQLANIGKRSRAIREARAARPYDGPPLPDPADPGPPESGTQSERELTPKTARRASVTV
jgi:hypothetical protein